MFHLFAVFATVVLVLDSTHTLPNGAIHQNVSKETGKESGSQGYIIVAGGWNGGNLASSYAFDIEDGTWSPLPDLPTARYGGGLVTHEDNVFFASGYGSGYLKDVLQLSTSQSMWIEISPLRTIANAGANALSISNSMYVLGGESTSLEQISSCNGGGFVWNKVSTTLQTHKYSGAAVLNGLIYVCGTSWDIPSTFCESYDPATNQFYSITPMNEARTSLSMVALSGYLYVIGGADANNERYDPVSDEWTHFSHVPSQKYWQSAATDGQRIYVVGGTEYTDTVSMYEPELDIWQSQTPYPVKVSYASATYVDTLP